MEGDAKIAAVGVEPQFRRLAPLRDHRRDPAGGGKQGRGLRLNDLQIVLLARLDPALGGELVDLTLGNDGRGAAQNLEHLEAAILDHQFEAAREEEIADQHARRIAPDDVGGALAPAEARAVDHVIVEQSGGVDELHGGGELVMASAAVIEQSRARQSQHRPHALAAACDQMAGQLGDQGDLALHPLEDHRIHMIQVRRDELHHRLERWRAVRHQRNDVGGHLGGDVRRRPRKGKRLSP